MAESKTKKEAGKIKQTDNSWVNASEKAVYVKVSPKDLQASKEEYEGNVTHTFVLSKQLLKNLIDGNGKAIKLGVFSE